MEVFLRVGVGRRVRGVVDDRLPSAEDGVLHFASGRGGVDERVAGVVGLVAGGEVLRREHFGVYLDRKDLGFRVKVRNR